MNKKIGILGGIGPEATGKLYSNIILQLQKEGKIKSNEDYPQIVINSINAPDLVNKSDIGKYLEGIKELSRFNLDFIVIACNTAHIYLNDLQKETKITIINLPRLVKNILKNEEGEILILGSSSTIKSGLYKFKGIKYKDLSERDINDIDKLIIAYSNGEVKESVIKLENILKKFGKNLTILSACTEISLMLNTLNNKSIDTMEILLKEIIKKLK